MKAVNVDKSSFDSPFETMKDDSLELEQLQIRCDELESALDAAKKEIDDTTQTLSKTVLNLIAERDSLQQQLDAAKKAIRSVTEELTDEIHILRGDRDKYITERDQAVAELREAREEANVFRASNGALTSEVIELRARVERLEKALNGLLATIGADFAAMPANSESGFHQAVNQARTSLADAHAEKEVE